MKKFKTKKKINYKMIILFLIFIIIFVLLNMIKLNKSNEMIIKRLLNNIESSDNNKNLISNLDTLLTTYYFKKENKETNKKNKPIIYLYNTYNLEQYVDNTSIVDATSLLKNKLINLDITVIQEEKKASELLHTGISYYDITKLFIKEVMNKEKNISYYIDIHRDNKKNTTVTINNKKYAKIGFVLSKKNANYAESKKTLNKMTNYLDKNYPGLSQDIYEIDEEGINDTYNQELNNNVILIELGGINNNYEELNNSTEILALMLYHILGG